MTRKEFDDLLASDEEAQREKRIAEFKAKIAAFVNTDFTQGEN